MFVWGIFMSHEARDKEPAEICGEEDAWVLTRDYISSTGAEMRERIMAKELSVKE